ncbi:MAG: Phosphoserine phosphatase [Alphaproteobacteria bacterium MarineAlpha3_Bin3]|jgi:phosphoserine phosphatase|nr:MAG: Phosphoserine phosphatase [Alphaproteobacteria bacterium MarineAlpha3_Bin3]
MSPPVETVLTLIAPAGGLDETIVASVAKALKVMGVEAGEADWLSPGEACDIPFSGANPQAAETAVREALSGAAVDLLAQPAAGRRKSLLVADMDCTIITTETLDELAARAGRKEDTAAITERAMQGEIDFAEALKERVAMLEGLEQGALEVTLAAVALSPGAETLVRTMAGNGVHTVLVSGGFGFFTEPVAAMAGFDETRSNRFEIADGRLTGRVIEPILGPEAKLETLTGLSAERQISLARTLAIGDGANDAPMIRAAGLGIAYRGKPVAREAARARIEACGLTAALYMQGYRRDEFAR